MNNRRETIGKTIKKKREDRFLTRKDLATFIGVSPATLASYEQGRTMPNITIVARLCAILGGNAGDYIE